MKLKQFNMNLLNEQNGLLARRFFPHYVIFCYENALWDDEVKQACKVHTQVGEKGNPMTEPHSGELNPFPFQVLKLEPFDLEIFQERFHQFQVASIQDH